MLRADTLSELMAILDEVERMLDDDPSIQNYDV